MEFKHLKSKYVLLSISLPLFENFSMNQFIRFLPLTPDIDQDKFHIELRTLHYRNLVYLISFMDLHFQESKKILDYFIIFP